MDDFLYKFKLGPRAADETQIINAPWVTNCVSENKVQRWFLNYYTDDVDFEGNLSEGLTATNIMSWTCLKQFETLEAAGLKHTADAASLKIMRIIEK